MLHEFWVWASSILFKIGELFTIVLKATTLKYSSMCRLSLLSEFWLSIGHHWLVCMSIIHHHKRSCIYPINFDSVKGHWWTTRDHLLQQTYAPIGPIFISQFVVATPDVVGRSPTAAPRVGLWRAANGTGLQAGVSSNACATVWRI